MKNKKFKLRSMTDIKVFLLFLLDRIEYPIDHTTLIDIVAKNTDEIIIDYDECLRDLSDSEHIISDEVDGEHYYMISDTGRMVSAELYDSLDKEFLERSMIHAARYVSLSKTGLTTTASITETSKKRYKVNMRARRGSEEYLNVTLTVNSRTEAEKMKENFESRPDSVYRGILFAATGRLEFLS